VNIEFCLLFINKKSNKKLTKTEKQQTEEEEEEKKVYFCYTSKLNSIFYTCM